MYQLSHVIFMCSYNSPWSNLLCDFLFTIAELQVLIIHVSAVTCYFHVLIQQPMERFLIYYSRTPSFNPTHTPSSSSSRSHTSLYSIKPIYRAKRCVNSLTSFF